MPPLVSEDGSRALHGAGRGARTSPAVAAVRGSASGWTTCRSPSSWRLRGRRCSRAEQLLERLGQRLDLLKAAAMPIRASRPCERRSAGRTTCSTRTSSRLFRRLAVFVGGCTYEAAEAVCDADPDSLQSLLDKSLLRRRDARAALLDAGDDPRVRRRAARGGRGSGRAAAPPRRLLPGARRAGRAGDVGARAADLVRPARFRARQPQGCADRDPWRQTTRTRRRGWRPHSSPSGRRAATSARAWATCAACSRSRPESRRSRARRRSSPPPGWSRSRARTQTRGSCSRRP